MIQYLSKVKEMIGKFKEVQVKHVPRLENQQADALPRLASSTPNDNAKTVF